MPTATVRARSYAACELNGRMLELEYALGATAPEGEGWHGPVPLGPSSLWHRTCQEDVELWVAKRDPRDPDAAETLWVVGEHVASVRYELLDVPASPEPGILVVPIGRWWLRVLLRR